MSSRSYTLIAKLGVGSYGMVFSARDTTTGICYALKKMDTNINPNDPYDQGMPVTLLREAGILKNMRHDNVIDLREVLMRQAMVVFVFELCHCNLRQHIGQLQSYGNTTMEAGQLRSFTRQILSAVSFFHERRILHRDLKPDNILLDATRQHVKVADFGMARPFTSRRTYTGRCVTAWYRPPEIILGDAQYGSAVDMWSVACIFAEMINLCPVFRCNTEFECLILAFRFLGTPTDANWPGVSSFPHFLASFPKWPVRSSDSVIEIDASILCPGAASLLRQMLQLNPERRVSARYALENSAFFSSDPSRDDSTVVVNDVSTVDSSAVDVSTISAAETVGQSEQDDLVGNVLEEEEEDRICGAAQCEENGDASSDSSAPTPAAHDRDDPPVQSQPAGGPAVFVAATGTAPPHDGEGGRRLERPPASPAKRLCRGLEAGGRSGECAAT
jgi:serine/threonine protein kinase